MPEPLLTAYLVVNLAIGATALWQSLRLLRYLGPRRPMVPTIRALHGQAVALLVTVLGVLGLLIVALVFPSEGPDGQPPWARAFALLTFQAVVLGSWWSIYRTHRLVLNGRED